MTSTRRVITSAVGVIVLVSGCSASPDAGAAASVAEELAAAVRASDGAAACDLLAPAAVRSLESQFSSACEEAVLEPDVTAEITDGGTTASEAHAYGQQAQVHLEGDTVFLTMSGDAWLVTAAGCSPRLDQPYECSIEGS
jgi:hypothetical protein